MKKTILLVIVSFLFLSCSKSDAPTGSNLPTIINFSADTNEIMKGEIAVLSWNVSNAISVQIDNGIGSVANSGTLSISPTATTKYILTATNNDGMNSMEITITVYPSVIGKWHINYKYHNLNYTGLFHITFYSDRHYYSDGDAGTWQGAWSQTQNKITWIYTVNNCTYTGTFSDRTMEGTMTYPGYTGDWWGKKE